MARYSATLIGVWLLFCSVTPLVAGDAEWASYQQNLKLRNYPAALQTLTQLADQNDPKATLTLAQWYRNGTGGKKDAVKSRQLMQKAAEQGQAEAQYQLGLMTLKGIGGDKNPTLARTWLEKAAQQHHAKALQEIAVWQAPAVILENSGQVRTPAASPELPIKTNKSVAPTLSPLQQRLAAVQQSSQPLLALRRAVLKSDTAMVTALLNSFTPQQQREAWAHDADGHTLITLAAQQASSEMLALLLSRADLPAWQDANGRNALFAALKGRRPDNVALLLKRRCDPMQADAQGMTPLAWAIQTGHPSALALLTATDVARWQPAWLTTAALHHDHTLALALLQAGISVTYTDAEGRDALWYAAQQGNLALVKALMAAGALPSLSDKAGDTPLHVASQQGHVEAINALLAKGKGASTTALLKQVNTKGSTALHLASAAGQRRAVDALLTAGADIDQRDHAGNTSLIVAVINHRYDVIKLLLQRGAGLDKRNNNKKTALDIADQLGDQEVGTLLRTTAKQRGVMSIFQ